MKVPYSWLKEFVDIDITPAELGDKLVSVGFEIEEVIEMRDSIKNVVAGKILSVEKHPDSDHLLVCSVDVGTGKVQIVTGAQNVKTGDVVPVALDGAVLPDGKKINSGALRGVKSEGMMCSGGELALTESDYPGAGVYGILILDAKTQPGTDINEVIGNTETVLDVAITANRPDCNSILGIAREVAAVTGKKLRMPNLSYTVSDYKTKDFISVENRNFELCPRYMAGAVTEVTECESPKIIRDRLKAVGIRPINNLVDVTNYVLTEIGQPMHAFDLKNLAGGKIVVRNAAEGEKITALDGKEYSLKVSQLAICDAEKPVAIAGVMGEMYASIGNDTETVILESARFARDSIRHTSRELNLRSDSSARYEKGIDFYSQELGLKRALSLFSEYGWGKIAEGFIDANMGCTSEKTLVYDYKAVNSIIGIDVEKERIIKILNNLELSTTAEGDVLTTFVPDYREDIEGVNDIAEEVVRFYGYDELAPRLISTKRGGKSPEQLRSDKLKNMLVGYGAYETVSYSFISPKAFDMLLMKENDPLRKAVEISNPLGADFSIMRTTLSYSMLKIINTNYKRGNKEGRFFEIANVYLPESLPLEKLPEEKQHIVIAFYGENEGFYKLKGVLEDISETFALNFEFKREEISYLHPGRTASVYSDGKKIGYVGEVHPSVQDTFEIDKRIYLAELDADYIFEKGIDIKPYKAFSKYQAVERDLALLAPIDEEAAKILGVISSAAGNILEKMEIFDVYVGGQVPKGKKSVAVKLLFRLHDGTLTDSEINARIEKILEALKSENVFLR